MSYHEKVPHYLKENLLAKSLHPQTYINNPNFLSMALSQNLKFQSHEKFRKADIDERQWLIQQICEQIWAWESNNYE